MSKLGRFLGAALVGMVAGCAAVPDALRAPSGQLLTQQLHANGVQIYECQPSRKDAAVFEWSLLAPEATLFDKTGQQVAKHYAGPTWAANDGSVVVGQVVARAESPGGESIPWLLLHAKSMGGHGEFDSVTYIQRLYTVGGNAPAACIASQVQQQLRVPYSADYFFYSGAR